MSKNMINDSHILNNNDENSKFSKRVLIYFGYALLPITSGAHARILDIAKEFIKNGYEVALATTNLYDIKNYKPQLIKKLWTDYHIKCYIHLANDVEADYCVGIKWKRVNSPQLKNHFKQVYETFKPDIVIMNYAYDADVIDLNFCKDSVNIIDMLDPISISNKIMDYTQKCVNFIKKDFHNPKILDKIKNSKYYDFLDTTYNNHQPNAIDDDELNIYNSYDITIAISKKEQDYINAHNTNKNAIFIPQFFEPNKITSSCLDAPIFIVGSAPLNLQAYLFFALKVLPIILKFEPNFKLKVFGKASLKYPRFKGIELVGYVENLDDIYKNACFSISPLLAGTGQQIKIVESLSYGVPVIMLDCLKDSAPIENAKEGFIARNELEFATYCIALFRDRTLAKFLGANAHKKTKSLLNEKQKYFNNLLSLIEKKKIEKTSMQNENNTSRIKVVTMPLVSIIMPVYNKAKFLQESIQSVAKQEYPNIELIIVNDGSKDNSYEVSLNEIKKYKNHNMQVFTKENLGVAHTRNYGFFRAKGDYLMNFDADDILCPSYVSKLVLTLENTHTDVCFSNLEMFGNEVSKWIPNDYSQERIKYENTIPASAIFRNILFALTKGQKVSLGFGEDWEFWVNMSRFGIKVSRVNEELYRYRVIDDGIMGTYIKDSYDDTLIQVLLNDSDLYSTSDVFKTIHKVPNMKEKSLESINRLGKLHPYEWYPYFIKGILAEADGDYQKASKYYNLSANLTNNHNWLPLIRWSYLTRSNLANA